MVLEPLDLSIGEPRNPHSHDFGTFGRGPGSQSQLFLSLWTPGHPKTSRAFLGICPIIKILANLETLEINVQKDGKGGHRQFLENLGYEITVYRQSEMEIW